MANCKICLNSMALALALHFHKNLWTCLQCGKQIVLSFALVGVCTKCGALAQRVLVKYLVCVFFDCEECAWKRSTSAWRALCWEDISLKIQYVQDMQEGPSIFKLACILKACGNIGVGNRGKEIHIEIVSWEKVVCLVMIWCVCALYVVLSLKHECLNPLLRIWLRTFVSWFAVISGYAQQGQGHDAFNNFKHNMRTFTRGKTLPSLHLRSLWHNTEFDKWKQIHAKIVRQELLGDDIVHGAPMVERLKCSVRWGSTIHFECMLHAAQIALTWGRIHAEHGLFGFWWKMCVLCQRLYMSNVVLLWNVKATRVLEAWRAGCSKRRLLACPTSTKSALPKLRICLIRSESGCWSKKCYASASILWWPYGYILKANAVLLWACWKQHECLRSTLLSWSAQ